VLLLFHLQGLVDGDGAIMLVEPRHLDQLLHPTFENEKAYQRDVITRGLGASPGAAVGKLVFTAGECGAGSECEQLGRMKDVSPTRTGRRSMEMSYKEFHWEENVRCFQSVIRLTHSSFRGQAASA
jgi:hypothetical protein